MRKLSVKTILITVIPVVISGCNNPDPKNPPTEKAEGNAAPVEVQTNPVETGTFEREILSNGLLQPLHKATLSFERSGVLNKLNIVNGQRVQKGDTLAVLDTKQAFPVGNRRKFKKTSKKISFSLKSFYIRPIDEKEPTPGLFLPYNKPALERIRINIHRYFQNFQRGVAQGEKNDKNRGNAERNSSVKHTKSTNKNQENFNKKNRFKLDFLFFF